MKHLGIILQWQTTIFGWMGVIFILNPPQAAAQELFQSFLNSAITLESDIPNSGEELTRERTNHALSILKNQLNFRCVPSEDAKYPGSSFQVKRDQEILTVSTNANDLSPLVETEISSLDQDVVSPISQFTYSLTSGRFKVTTSSSNVEGTDWNLLYQDHNFSGTPPAKPFLSDEIPLFDLSGNLLDHEHVAQLAGMASSCIRFVDSLLEEGIINDDSGLDDIFANGVNCNPSNFNECNFKVLQKCDSEEPYKSITNEIRDQMKKGYKDGSAGKIWVRYTNKDFAENLTALCQAYGASSLPGSISSEAINAVLNGTSNHPDRKYCYDKSSEALRKLNIDIVSYESKANEQIEAQKKYERELSEYKESLQKRENLFLNIRDFAISSTTCCRDKKCQELYQTEIQFQ